MDWFIQLNNIIVISYFQFTVFKPDLGGGPTFRL